MSPQLSILIPTLASRQHQFIPLLLPLLNQAARWGGQVEVIAYWNQGERPLPTIRQLLMLEATGTYVCFVDDDDQVPNYYCDKIMRGLADTPDYVGWRMQAYVDGQELKPTYHSLKYAGWSEDDDGFYRDISHLNPLKRQIALQADFRAGPLWGDDSAWAAKIRAAEHSPRTEHYIPEIMYRYFWDSQHTSFPSQQQRRVRPPGGEYRRPDLQNPWFRWHPMSPTYLVA